MTAATLETRSEPARAGHLFEGAEWNFLTVQRVYAASISGSPFSNWAGPVEIAAGGEFRKESINNRADPLQVQGIYPDVSAANFELMTAKLSPKDISTLKRSFPRHGFVKEIDALEKETKEFSKRLLDKNRQEFFNCFTSFGITIN